MNTPQRLLINEALAVWEYSFKEYISLEEFRLNLEAQYLPIEFMFYSEGTFE